MSFRPQWSRIRTWTFQSERGMMLNFYQVKFGSGFWDTVLGKKWRTVGLSPFLEVGILRFEKWHPETGSFAYPLIHELSLVLALELA